MHFPTSSILFNSSKNLHSVKHQHQTEKSTANQLSEKKSTQAFNNTKEAIQNNNKSLTDPIKFLFKGINFSAPEMEPLDSSSAQKFMEVNQRIADIYTELRPHI